MPRASEGKNNRVRQSRVGTETESGLPSTYAGFRRSRTYILDSMLTASDYVPPDVLPCGLFQGSELIYRRSDIIPLRSDQGWKSKFSLTVRASERPIRVIQKDVGGVSRTIELFSQVQTQPLPNLVASAVNGIPTNEFGNVEVARIPANASLIPVPTESMTMAMRACKALGDVPWCKCQTGWKRKRPVFGGLVVLDRDEEKVGVAIAIALSEQSAKEAEETRQATLSLWRQLFRRISAEWYMRSVVDPNAGRKS